MHKIMHGTDKVWLRAEECREGEEETIESTSTTLVKSLSTNPAHDVFSLLSASAVGPQLIFR